MGLPDEYTRLNFANRGAAMRAGVMLLAGLLALLMLGCGSDGSTGSLTAPLASSGSGSGSSTSLTAVLDFGPNARQLVKLDDNISGYVVEAFTLQGQVLASQSGIRAPGSGPVTVTLSGLAPGLSVIVRVVARDNSGKLLGYEDLPAVTGVTTTLVFANLTPGPPPVQGPSPSPVASPSPAGSVSPAPSPSPAASPSPSAAPAPSASPAPSPSPAASPGGPLPVSLLVAPVGSSDLPGPSWS